MRRQGPREDAPQLVYGIHPVADLLGHRPREVERIYITQERASGLGRVLRAAREAGIPVTRLPRDILVRKIGRRAVHQGIAAQVSSLPYAEADAVCLAAQSRPDGLLVLVDRVVDPGNLGAIVRTSAAAGATGVLLGGEGTVGLTPAVVKVSAGAVERVPVAREAKPVRRLESLASAGFRCVVLDPHGATPWDELDLTGRLVLVAGGEERGVRPAVARACEFRVGIPLAGGSESLNVGISVGVLLFEALRQRRRAGSALESSLSGC